MIVSIIINLLCSYYTKQIRTFYISQKTKNSITLNKIQTTVLLVHGNGTGSNGLGDRMDIQPLKINLCHLYPNVLLQKKWRTPRGNQKTHVHLVNIHENISTRLFIISRPLCENWYSSANKHNLCAKKLTVCRSNTHNLLKKMTFTVQPLPCNYCVRALCLHWTNLAHLHACIKAKGSNFEHNLP